MFRASTRTTPSSMGGGRRGINQPLRCPNGERSFNSNSPPPHVLGLGRGPQIARRPCDGAAVPDWGLKVSLRSYMWWLWSIVRTFPTYRSGERGGGVEGGQTLHISLQWRGESGLNSLFSTFYGAKECGLNKDAAGPVAGEESVSQHPIRLVDRAGRLREGGVQN